MVAWEISMLVSHSLTLTAYTKTSPSQPVHTTVYCTLVSAVTVAVTVSSVLLLLLVVLLLCTALIVVVLVRRSRTKQLLQSASNNTGQYDISCTVSTFSNYI